MVHWGWLIVAFLLGGFIGFSVMVLLTMAAGCREQMGAQQRVNPHD